MTSFFNLRCAITAAALYSVCGAATTQQPTPDAASLYRSAFEEMNRALQIKSDDPVDYPEVDPPDIGTFRAAPWPALLRQTAVARALFAQAAAHQRCAFDKARGETGIEDEVTEHFGDFNTVRAFVVAHAFSVVTDRPDAALADAEALLAAAQHLEQQGGLFSIMMANNLAGGGLLICEAMLGVTGDLAPRPAILRRALKAVQARRDQASDPRRIADRAVKNARVLLATLASPKAKNILAIQAARARAIEMVDALVEPLRTARAGDADKLRKATEIDVANLRAKLNSKRTAEILEEGVGEALAAALATMVAPDSVKLFQAWEKHRRQLDRIAAALRGRCDTKSASKQR